MGKAILGIVIVIFDVILAKAWLAARAAAALGHGPAPSNVKYGVILGFSLLVLVALARSKKKPPASRGGYGGSSRGGYGSGSSWTGR